MIIFPAVDIQDGKAVRLKQGRALYEGTLDLVEANAWIAAQQ